MTPIRDIIQMQNAKEKEYDSISNSLFHELCIALLAGGIFSLIEIFSKISTVKLPISQCVEYLSYVTYFNWLAAVCFITIQYLPFIRSILKSVWSGWIVFSMFLLIACFLKLRVNIWPLRIIAPIALASFAVILAEWISRKIHLLQTVRFWAFINYFGLVILLIYMSFLAPLGHAVYLNGVLIYLPVVIISTTILIIFLKKPVNNVLAGCSVMPFIILFSVWVIAPLFQSEGIKKRPNVILISVDTLRKDHLGNYGNRVVKTPFIDSLAKRGVVFENAITPIPLTNPSHSTMLTGLYPANHGVTDNLRLPFSKGVELLPKILNDHGYKTAGFVSGMPLQHEVTCLKEYFEVYDDHLGMFSSIPNLCLHHIIPLFVAKGLRKIGKDYLNLKERVAEKTLDSVIPWLEGNAENSFFLFVHLFDPHGPYNPPAPYDTMYDPGYNGKTDGDWYGIGFRGQERIINNPQELRHFKALYAGEISYVDKQLGKLFRAFDQLKLWDNTLVVFTSDHGESLTEHDYYFDHSLALYDPSLRVPLIFCIPNGKAKVKRISSTVQLTDIFPTILDFLKIKMSMVDGRSLLSFLDGSLSKDPHRIAISAIFKEGAWSKLLSLRSSKYKYIFTSSRWYGARLLPPIEEFYALDQDPGETVNIAFNAVKSMEPFRQLAKNYIELWFSNKKQASPRISEEALKNLKSLGYVK